MILKQRLQTEGLKRGNRLMRILGKQRGQYLYNILDSDDKKEHIEVFIFKTTVYIHLCHELVYCDSFASHSKLHLKLYLSLTGSKIINSEHRFPVQSIV